jgi:hypothetical protein
MLKIKYMGKAETIILSAGFAGSEPLLQYEKNDMIFQPYPVLPNPGSIP